MRPCPRLNWGGRPRGKWRGYSRRAGAPPAPSSPRPRPARTAQGAGGWSRWSAFALPLLAAFMVFLDIHYLGVPLAIKSQVLAHGLFMHAAGTLFLLPFAGDSSRPLSGWSVVRWT